MIYLIVLTKGTLPIYQEATEITNDSHFLSFRLKTQIQLNK